MSVRVVLTTQKLRGGALRIGEIGPFKDSKAAVHFLMERNFDVVDDHSLKVVGDVDISLGGEQFACEGGVMARIVKIEPLCPPNDFKIVPTEVVALNAHTRSRK